MTAFGDAVARRLKEAAQVFEDRSGVYKDNYKVVGDLVSAAFPDGITLVTAADFERWHILELMFVKLARYTNNYSAGGHEDSLTDLVNYATMLAQIDSDQGLTQDQPDTEIGNVAPEVPGWDTESGPLAKGDRVRFKGGNVVRRVTALGPTDGRVWVEDITESFHQTMLEKVG